MNGTDLIVIAIIAALLAGALFYIRRSKKAGKRCVGCPDSGCCPRGGDHCSCGDRPPES